MESGHQRGRWESGMRKGRSSECECECEREREHERERECISQSISEERRGAWLIAKHACGHSGGAGAGRRPSNTSIMKSRQQDRRLFLQGTVYYYLITYQQLQ